jgi:hypothetical protein
MFKLFLCLICLGFLNDSRAVDPQYILNNKEHASHVLKPSHRNLAHQWVMSFGDRALALTKAKSYLANVLMKVEKQEAICDLGFVDLMIKEGVNNNTLRDEDDLTAVMSFLRIENQIDDLLFENILNSQDLQGSIDARAGSVYPRSPINSLNDNTKDIDLKTTYQEFATWPDDQKRCSLSAYYRLSTKLTWKNVRERNQLLKRLNYLALDKELISLETYHKLEVFREKDALDWPVHLFNYIDIVRNAKDKLSPTKRPVQDPAVFSTKYADRKSKLTHRERLYKNFNSTQIMILAGIIEKTAKRMDSRYVAINFQYTNEPEISEIYVLSPMERYRLSLKMLIKDMAETMRSDIFGGKTIEYEDLVTAAYETGYIKASELELVLKFEDFWNPQTPKWKMYANFAFSLVGTAVWFLPPPWNIVGALALVITQTKVVNGDKPADADDNWNVVI